MHWGIIVIAWHLQIDMVQIKACFLEQYKQTLWKFIENDCSGDYRKLLQAIVGMNWRTQKHETHSIARILTVAHLMKTDCNSDGLNAVPLHERTRFNSALRIIWICTTLSFVRNYDVVSCISSLLHYCDKRSSSVQCEPGRSQLWAPARRDSFTSIVITFNPLDFLSSE